MFSRSSLGILSVLSAIRFSTSNIHINILALDGMQCSIANDISLVTITLFRPTPRFNTENSASFRLPTYSPS
ncbi:hypothetical protein EV426DRAFT_605844 [Tirmania nivea]|nr:hypothetical protein EV426DRAFT_605844 [Tirmania nivea]